jgi:hypothetical protein
MLWNHIGLLFIRIFYKSLFSCFDYLTLSFWNRDDQRHPFDMPAGVTLGLGRIKLIS